MRGPTYSEADLLALKESPLVKKPDGLPSISQWMDVPADQNTNNGHANNNNGTMRRTRGARDGEGATPNEQRPLINPMGQFGRRQSMRKSSDVQGIKAAIDALFVEPGEETVLGPPKLAFLSARTPAKGTGDAKTMLATASQRTIGGRGTAKPTATETRATPTAVAFPERTVRAGPTSRDARVWVRRTLSVFTATATAIATSMRVTLRWT